MRFPSLIHDLISIGRVVKYEFTPALQKSGGLYLQGTLGCSRSRLLQSYEKDGDEVFLTFLKGENFLLKKMNP